MENGKKLNIKAILIGWLVDTAGTIIAGVVIGIIAGAVLTAKGIAPNQIAEELSNSIALQKISLFIGFSLTFAGGYVAALLAKEDEIKHALMVGVLSLTSSLIITAAVSEQDASLYLISFFVVPFAVLGGYLRKTTKKEGVKK
jgi:hypothetical protein